MGILEAPEKRHMGEKKQGQQEIICRDPGTEEGNAKILHAPGIGRSVHKTPQKRQPNNNKTKTNKKLQ